MNLRAISLGLLTDMGATLVVGSMVGIVLSGGMATQGSSPEQVEAALSKSPAILALMVVVGLACTLAGGYVAAHLAPGGEMRHALATGALSLGLNLLTVATTSTRYPAWFLLLSLGLVLPCAALGGWLRLRAPRENGTPQSGRPPIPPP